MCALRGVVGAAGVEGLGNSTPGMDAHLLRSSAVGVVCRFILWLRCVCAEIKQVVGHGGVYACGLFCGVAEGLGGGAVEFVGWVVCDGVAEEEGARLLCTVEVGARLG